MKRFCNGLFRLFHMPRCTFENGIFFPAFQTHQMKKKLLLASLFLLANFCTRATTWYVKTSGAGSGASWADANGDLQAVINMATAGDSIYIATGTYLPNRRADSTDVYNFSNRNNAFVPKNGVAIFGGFPTTGTPVFADRDPATYPTILSGDFNADDVLTGSGETLAITNNSENAYHVMVLAGNDSTTRIDGLSVRAGNANGTGNVIYVSGYSIPDNFGGGIMNKHAAPGVNNCIFAANMAGYGGGIFNADSASPTITNCTFSKNYAFSGIGGGIYNETTFITLYNSGFSGNLAALWGGGIYNNNSSVKIDLCRFSENDAQNGAGTFSDNALLLQIEQCTFTNNSVLYSGGGIQINNSSNAIVRKCSFADNTAGSTGGGIFCDNASATIAYGTFHNNTALAGGGIHNNSGMFHIANCTFFDNIPNVSN